MYFYIADKLIYFYRYIIYHLRPFEIYQNNAENHNKNDPCLG